MRECSPGFAMLQSSLKSANDANECMQLLYLFASRTAVYLCE